MKVVHRISILQYAFAILFEAFKYIQDASEMIDLQLRAPNAGRCTE